MLSQLSKDVRSEVLRRILDGMCNCAAVTRPYRGVIACGYAAGAEALLNRGHRLGLASALGAHRKPSALLLSKW